MASVASRRPRTDGSWLSATVPSSTSGGGCPVTSPLRRLPSAASCRRDQPHFSRFTYIFKETPRLRQSAWTQKNVLCQPLKLAESPPLPTMGRVNCAVIWNCVTYLKTYHHHHRRVACDNQTTIPQLIANNMSVFFSETRWTFTQFLLLTLTDARADGSTDAETRGKTFRCLNKRFTRLRW